jgi:opacity protein-like surface antigen
MTIRAILFFLINLATNAIASYAQSADTSYPKLSILIAHDLFCPLFGRAMIPPDLRKSITNRYTGPILGGEYAFTKNKKWSAGVKAGWLGDNRKSTTKTLSAQTGLDTSLIDERVATFFAFNIYTKFQSRSNKKLQPYAGAGFGVRWNKTIEKNSFSDGRVLESERKYWEQYFLLKAGLLYSISRNFGIYTEIEYPAMPSHFLAGVLARF